MARPEAGRKASLRQRLRGIARAAARDVIALHLAAGDPRVPWYAKAVAACVALYALSPIDLIPDIVPVLGQLDDLILVPLGIMLAVRLIPPEVLADLRRQADRVIARPRSRTGAIAVVLVWILAAAVLAWWAAVGDTAP